MCDCFLCLGAADLLQGFFVSILDAYFYIQAECCESLQLGHGAQQALNHGQPEDVFCTGGDRSIVPTQGWLFGKWGISKELVCLWWASVDFSSFW